MSKTDIFFCAVLLAALVWGLEQVALSPLETGDVYPPYSSLRSDPLGSKALYESLAALPGVAVERLYKPRTALDNPHDTLLVLGVDPVSWSTVNAKTLEGYENLVRNGGRLVIGFLPVRTAMELPEKRPAQERWDIELKFERGSINTSLADTSSAIPRATALFFQAGPSWTQIDRHNAVERPFGSGTIVLVAATFPLSNEGLREARDAQFIAAIAGPAHRIIFDENHFGVVETGSVTKLIRKYRLEGAVAMLALAAGLFVWRGASSFLPPRVTEAKEAVTGRDSVMGMAALLHRGVAEKDLLDTCYREWAKSTPAAPRGVGKDRLRIRVEEEIRRVRDPVEAYRAAAKVVTEKKWRSINDGA